MSSYKLLDDAIVEHIAKAFHCHPIYAPNLLMMAGRELGYEGSGAVDEKVWRLIDRRLQALRRTGRIAYAHKGKQWRVA